MDLSSVKNVIIRFPNWLGDCIMATPVLAALSDNFPDWNLNIMVRGSLAQLFQHDPRIKAVISIDDRRGRFRFLQYFKIANEISKYRYDLAIVLPESFSSAFIIYLAGIPSSIGYTVDLRSFMLTDIIQKPDKLVHRSRKYLNIVAALGGKLDEGHQPQIYSDQRSLQKAEKLLDGRDQFVVINPISRAPSRRWGIDKYAALANRIHSELDIDIVFSGAPDEVEIIEEVGRKSGVEYLNIAGKSDLMTSYEVLNKANVYVGNDSGGAHLASVTKAYTISISGADDPDETRPLAQHGKIIRKPLPCSPCVKNVCPRDDIPNECMSIISVDDVFDAVREAVNE